MFHLGHMKGGETMGKIKKVAILFEQSGTFKKEFKKLNINAIDIDIENNFNETDILIDIFKALENNDFIKYLNSFDLILAFFPCTWFNNYNHLIFSDKWKNYKKMNRNDIKEYKNKRMLEREFAVCKLFKLINSIKKPMIIENPNSSYIKELLGEPTLKHSRNLYGDYMKKPTFYYCFNGAFIDDLDKIVTNANISVEKLKGIKRSLISSEYANNFVKHIKII